MKRIGYLYDRIVSVENCRQAILAASKGKMKRKKVREIVENVDWYAIDLSARLQKLDFLSPYTTRVISDGLSGKKRELQIPHFYPDQCAHHALIRVLAPIFAKSMYYWSCANVPGKGIDHACKGVERYTKKNTRYAKYCVKLDIRKFYPSVPHDKLKASLRRKIKDKRALELIDLVIDSHPQGIPIGNYTSPWLAEFFLQPLDYYIKQELHVKCFVRYADDHVMTGNNKKVMRKVMYSVKEYVEGMGMALKDNYQLFLVQKDNKGGSKRGRKIDFVGRCFGRGFTTVRKRRALAFMRNSRHVQKLQKQGLPVPYKLAAGFLSRSACLKHTDSMGLRKAYYEPVNVKKLKEVIRNESKRQRVTSGNDPGTVQSPPWVCGTATA